MALEDTLFKAASVANTPAQGEPGTIVSISGSGFADDSTVFLATEEVPATVVGQKQLSFEIPELPPGLYALFVKRPDGSVSRSYSFTVQALKPIAIDGKLTCPKGQVQRRVRRFPRLP